MPVAAIGIGSNIGDPRKNVRAGVQALSGLGELVALSRLYRTKPWGREDQPDFCNAVALLLTERTPRDLLVALKALEVRLGRTPSERWGPRSIDFDILLYGDQTIAEEDLRIPHPQLGGRAFALVPLADVDRRYAEDVEALSLCERAGVVPIDWGEPIATVLEDGLRPGANENDVVERVRTFVDAFMKTDLVRLRIEEANSDSIEVRRRGFKTTVQNQRDASVRPEQPTPSAPEAIKADLVGIVHLRRPAPQQGDELKSDRELGYVEALGIRNPVRSGGPGRVVSVRCTDGQAVEYGQVLFEIDRS